MPNWCSNRMYFSGEPAQIAEIKRLASGAVTPLYRRATNEGIQLFLAEETIDGFREAVSIKKVPLPDVIYEDPHILLVNKPAGLLTQKAKISDLSLVDEILYYLEQTGKYDPTKDTAKPSVCNRLDRNTSGILLAGVSLPGSRELSRMLKDRSLSKYYLALVAGEVTQAVHTTAYLKKDNRQNRVTVSEQEVPGADRIETWYRPVLTGREYTLLEVQLITGKSHQIRAHLASLDHPVIGDPKYGDQRQNRLFENKAGVHRQLLHAYRVRFSDGSEVVADLPNDFETALAWLRSRTEKEPVKG